MGVGLSLLGFTVLVFFFFFFFFSLHGADRLLFPEPRAFWGLGRERVASGSSWDGRIFSLSLSLCVCVCVCGNIVARSPFSSSRIAQPFPPISPTFLLP